MPGLLTTEGLSILLAAAREQVLNSDDCDLGKAIVDVCGVATEHDKDKAGVLLIACLHCLKPVMQGVTSCIRDDSPGNRKHLIETLTEMMFLRDDEAAAELSQASEYLGTGEYRDKLVAGIVILIERYWKSPDMKDLISALGQYWE